MKGLGYTLRFFAADLAPMILFLVTFLITRNIDLTTGVAIAFGVAQLAWSFYRKIPHWYAAVGGPWPGGGVRHGDPADPRRPIHNVQADCDRPRADRRDVEEGLDGALCARDVARRGSARARSVRLCLGRADGDHRDAEPGVVFMVDPVTWARFNLFFPPLAIIALFALQNIFMRSRMAGAPYDLPAGQTPSI